MAALGAISGCCRIVISLKAIHFIMGKKGRTKKKEMERKAKNT